MAVGVCVGDGVALGATVAVGGGVLVGGTGGGAAVGGATTMGTGVGVSGASEQAAKIAQTARMAAMNSIGFIRILPLDQILRDAGECCVQYHRCEQGAMGISQSAENPPKTPRAFLL